MKLREILLVEDNDDDADLTLRALRSGQVRNPVIRVGDGVEAIDYLHALGNHASRDITNQPQVVLLDLNMPRMDGLEVLQRIRKHPLTSLLPVVILTTSKEEQDLVQAYERRANSYICKPVDFLEFTEIMHTLGLYWVLTNEPPPEPAKQKAIKE